jgi:microsomal dipeptidase-like Zn-dependent dipeptidase
MPVRISSIWAVSPNRENRGGGLPDYVEGWNDITELNLLGLAMLEEGFEKWEIAAFMGSNLLRVLHSCFEISHGK